MKLRGDATAMRTILLLTAVALAATAPVAAQMPNNPTPATMPDHGDTPPVDYTVPASWICRPGVDDGTCSANLDAMKIDAGGARTPAPHVIAKDAPIDCFYVYPTTSLDPTLYSDLIPDAEEKRSVHGQAARLGARCRLFVPAYHQLTMAALRWTMAHPATVTDFDVPYRDVLAAWKSYLAHDNHGRGVVLVGHSQGAILLKRLIAEQIDGKPAQKLLVAAYLAGNPDLNARSVHDVKPCAAPDQTGCVVAWSSYIDTYDGPRYFGTTPAGIPPLCVNPAAIGGGRGALETYLSKPSFAPAEDPPYVELAGQLTAECVADAQGAVLRIHIEPGPAAGLLGVVLQKFSPSPVWGEHPLDISLVQGNMIDLIGGQTKAWLAHHK
jgi:hypothetical protein